MRKPKSRRTRGSVENNEPSDFESKRMLSPFEPDEWLLDFDDWFNFGENFFKNFRKIRQKRHSTLPKINMRETETGYKLEIGIPGYDKDEVSLILRNNALEISGKTNNKKEVNDDGSYVLRELSSRSFHRVIPFPEEINMDSYTTRYKDGIIYLTIDKANQQSVEGKEIKF
jgi:HSP20 family protein